MRIALVSYEFPPSIQVGGIAAYSWEAALALTKKGISVEVFCAGAKGDEPAEEHGVKVHRLGVDGREDFREGLLETFAAIHRGEPFDLVEAPDYTAEALRVFQEFPDIARVVKLHTPSFLIADLTYEAPSFVQRLRFFLGGIRRGRVVRYPAQKFDDKEFALEQEQGRLADHVAAPCHSIKDRVACRWGLRPDKITVYPLPFQPSEGLLGLPLPEEVNTIGFVGRMEPRKGILELVETISLLGKKHPKTHFRLIGPDWPYQNKSLKEWALETYPDIQSRVTFVGSVKHDDMADQFAKCDAMVLPSRWENFPFACWESLAAGRVVIGSCEGGMADVIQHGRSGLLISPGSPHAIVEAIEALITEPEKVKEYAMMGRKRVLEVLDPDKVMEQQIDHYHQAIAERDARLKAQIT